MSDNPIKVTSYIDYDDLSTYGISVIIDDENGNTFIKRGDKVLVSIIHDYKNKTFEVKKLVNGELKTVLNSLIIRIRKYKEKLKEENFKIEELEKFLYEFICNNGYQTEIKELYKYDKETRRIFWEFFNEYVSIRFSGDYKKDVNIPELIEIENTIIAWDIEEEADEMSRKEFEHAQFFCYTRNKIRQKMK